VQKLTPWAYREYVGRKDQGWALLDGGSSPPPSDEDGHIIMDAAARQSTEAREPARNQIVKSSTRR
jgi:hypothetical protein